MSAEVMMAIDKLHEAQKILVCQLLWYLSIN